MADNWAGGKGYLRVALLDHEWVSSRVAQLDQQMVVLMVVD